MKAYQCHELGGNQYFEYEKGHLKRGEFSLQNDGPKLRIMRTSFGNNEQVSEVVKSS